MNIENEERLGTVKIGDELIGKLVLASSMEVAGFHSFVRKGIKIGQVEDGVILDLYIAVDYGVKIPEVAWNLQEKVKKDMELSFELKVKAVNIHVQGVHFVEEE